MIWTALAAVQSVLLFQLALVVWAWDGRQLPLLDVVLLALVLQIAQGPRPLVFLPALALSLLFMALVLGGYGAWRRRHGCHG